MAYIGKTPTVGNFQKCDAITVVNGQAAYTLQVGSANVSPESVNHMIVSLNGVIQAPTTAYTVAGATLTFASNLATGDVIDFVLLLGNVLDIGTPSDNTVATAKIQDDAVSLAKMAAGTDGNIISYDTSGNPVAVATGNDGQVLTSSGAGAVCAFEDAPAGGLTVADQWRLTTNFTGLAQPISSNLEQVDTAQQATLGSAMTQSSGVFTFPSTGYWLVTFDFMEQSGGTHKYIQGAIDATINNATYAKVTTAYVFIPTTDEYTSAHMSVILDVTDTANVKCRFDIDSIQGTASSATTQGDSAVNETYMTFLRLADT